MKKFIPSILFLLLFVMSSNLIAQVQITRQVIGSTGSYATGTTMTLSSTTGETVVQSLFSTSTILTQGFQQSLTNDSIVTYEVINESCNGANNGSIFINDVLGCAGPYTISVMALNTTTILDESTLAVATYTVDITGASGCTYSATIAVGLDSEEDCTLKFYSGFSPNGDGRNDQWVIENIELFPENTVKIFNRWGSEVWSGENYNNTDVVWIGLNKSGGDMNDATYFYVAEVGGQSYKGWVEVTR